MASGWKYDPKLFESRLRHFRDYCDLPRGAMTPADAAKAWGLSHRNSVIRLIQIGRIAAGVVDGSEMVFVLDRKKPAPGKPGRPSDKEDE